MRPTPITPLFHGSAARTARRALGALAIVCAVTGTTGCMTVTDGRPAAPAIVPLAVGNAWTYRDSIVFSRTEGGGDSVVIDSSLLEITGTRVVNYEGRTETVHLENAMRRPGTPPRPVHTYLKAGPRGLHTRGYSEGSAEVLDDVLHVKYPATTGERYPTWFVSLRAADSGAPEPVEPVRVRDTLEIEVVNADTTCTVPAGVFPCIHYRGWRHGGILHADAFYAPGVGYLGSVVTRARAVNGPEQSVTTVRLLSAYVLR